MTTSAGPQSMRFALHEVLAGMLASTDQDAFSDDAPALASMFEGLAGEFSLFAPLAAGVDPGAVSDAFGVLENQDVVEHKGGRYLLTESGRAQCVASKRTLFNRGDVEQLEAAARVFSTL